MVYYINHVINYLRGFSQAQGVYRAFEALATHEENQRKRSKVKLIEKYLAYRRGFFKEVFKDREKAWAKAKEKECLNCSRSTDIISFTGEKLCV